MSLVVALAYPIIAADRSTPTTRPNGPTRSARAMLSLPVPQATSIAEFADASPVAATAARRQRPSPPAVMIVFIRS